MIKFLGQGSESRVHNLTPSSWQTKLKQPAGNLHTGTYMPETCSINQHSQE